MDRILGAGGRLQRFCVLSLHSSRSAHDHSHKTTLFSSNSNDYDKVKRLIYLPPFRDGESVIHEIGKGFSKSSLEGWCKSEHFARYVPRFNSSPGAFDLAISICSDEAKKEEQISGNSARYLTMKVQAELAVSCPPINNPKILSAMSNSAMNFPSSSLVKSMCDNISCVGDAFPSAKSIFLCLMMACNSFLMNFEALMARLNGVPGRSMGTEISPEAKESKGSANLSTWLGSSMLTNKRHASQKV
ncbi:hypothetical protein RJ640_025520 [Escallonia rubra]|uniref:Uncharacterized protein n=1 Tax=Escallonia rubra TaxID=112253 RepID=A0AA88QY09_9ASTE|nr:hypothetical protein RJ640_025520 [Escallonia rubra]